MKKLCLLLLAISMMMLTACSGNTETTMQLNELGTAPTTKDSASSDEATHIPNISEILAREKYIPEAPDEYKGMNIIEKTAEEDMAINPTADNVIENCTHQVKATVEGFKNIYFSKFPWTIIYVRVDENLVGDFEEGKIMEIHTFGGYIPLRQFMGDSLYAHGNNMTEEEIDNTVVHFVTDDPPLPEIGKQYIFMLSYRELSGQMVYERFAGKYGQFEVLEDGYLYKIPADEDEPAIISFDQFEEKIELYKNETVEIK